MKYNDGFTLLELMILVAIIGILSGLAIPNMRTMKGRLVLGSEARDLINNLQKAKIEAIKTSRTINITINTNNYIIDGVIVKLKDGVTLTHNLVGTGPTTQINNMGVFDEDTLPESDPQIRVSSSFGDRIITISYGGMISTL